MRSSSATPKLPTAAPLVEANRVCAPKTIPLRIGLSAGQVSDWLIGAATKPTLPQFCSSMTPLAPPESGWGLEVDLCVPTATAAVVKSVAIAAVETKAFLIIVPSHTIMLSVVDTRDRVPSTAAPHKLPTAAAPMVV